MSEEAAGQPLNRIAPEQVGTESQTNRRNYPRILTQLRGAARAAYGSDCGAHRASVSGREEGRTRPRLRRCVVPEAGALTLGACGGGAKVVTSRQRGQVEPFAQPKGSLGLIGHTR